MAIEPGSFDYLIFNKKQKQMDATQLEEAKKLIAEQEKKELETVANKIEAILKEHGFALQACGTFEGSTLQTIVKLIKVSK